MALSKNKRQKSQILELKLKRLNMTVNELLETANHYFDSIVLTRNNESFFCNDYRYLGEAKEFIVKTWETCFDYNLEEYYIKIEVEQ